VPNLAPPYLLEHPKSTKILLCSLTCSQTWPHPLLEHHKSTYLTNLKNKTPASPREAWLTNHGFRSSEIWKTKPLLHLRKLDLPTMDSDLVKYEKQNPCFTSGSLTSLRMASDPRDTKYPHQALLDTCFSCLLAHVFRPCMVLHKTTHHSSTCYFYSAKEHNIVLFN